MKPHRGTLILVFGILGIVSCFPLGIAAWVMGKRDLKEMDAGIMDPSGRGNTNAGRICGTIGTLLATAVLLMFLVMAAVRFLSSSPVEGRVLEATQPATTNALPAR